MSKKRSSRNRAKKASAVASSSQPAPEGNVLSIPVRDSLSSWHRSGLVVGPVLLFFVLACDHIWVTEDAFISFKSVENFWSGRGPNFNAGIRVESFSHPLWFMLLVLFRLAGAAMLPVVAAWAGILLSCLGLLAAIQAGRLRFDKLPRLFPLGALVISVLPPFWDFASSGLETGLTFAWIGSSLLLLTMVAQEQRPMSSLKLFWLLGLAPLIRPDLLIIGVPFFILASLLTRRPGEGMSLLLARVACFVAPGTVWQIFRMGYFGLLLPNTYLAKEGLASRWQQGLVYLNDTYVLYWLYPVLAIGILLLGLSCYATIKKSSDNTVAFSLCAVPYTAIFAGSLHTLIVVRTGGDFMHARLLLPGLFCILSAVSVVALPLMALVRQVSLSVFLLWMVLVSLLIRPEYRSRISSYGIADERNWYVQRARTSRPITLNDYTFHSFFRTGEAIAKRAQSENRRAVYWAHLGLTAAALPSSVTVIDPLALNDHIGSHTMLLERGRPGHEKIVRAAWFLARYPAGSGLVVRNQLDGVFEKPETPEAIEAARQVLASPAVRELTEAVSAPLTRELFWRNVLRAYRLTRLRIYPDPVQALRALEIQDGTIPPR